MRLTMFPPSSKSISAYHITLILLLTSPSLTQASSPLILTPDNAHDNSSECDCYLISGPTPGYFQYHRFYDFRSHPINPRQRLHHRPTPSYLLRRAGHRTPSPPPTSIPPPSARTGPSNPGPSPLPRSPY